MEDRIDGRMMEGIMMEGRIDTASPQNTPPTPRLLKPQKNDK